MGKSGPYVIPSSVTDIGDRAFSVCLNLTNITIPDGIISIGDGAFDNCYSLTNITIPDSVVNIGSSAFLRCDNLNSITISKRITSISDNMFEGCDSLTSIVIPDGVTTIGNSAFLGCTALSNIDIPDSVVSIGRSSFSGCSASNIAIPRNVVDIGNSAFSNCNNLTNITIPDSVTNIGNYAFSNCGNLTNVIIGKGITSIAYRTFWDCSNLGTVTISHNVTSIEHDAFDGCSSLTDVYYSGSEAQWNNIVIGYLNDSLTSATIHFNSLGNITNESAFVGTWEIDDEKTMALNGDSMTSIFGHDYGQYGSEMEINADHTFTYGIAVGIGGEGDWRFDGSQIIYDIITYEEGQNESGTLQIESFGEDEYYLVMPYFTYQIYWRKISSSPGPSDEITFSIDIGKTFTINVGEQLPIMASFSPIEGMTENGVMWFTDDPEIADIDHVSVGSIGSEITSSIGWINGISPGIANISVTLPDGRTGSVEVTVKEKDGSNIPLKDFNVSVYRADLLFNRTDTPSSRTLFDLLSTRSPSRVIQEELYSDWSLLNAVDAWNAICNTFDTVDNPYNLHDLSFEEQDFYTAILMDILETNVSHRQTSSMESFVKTSKSLVGEATSFVKLKFDIKDYDNPFATEEDKENIANAYMEYFKTELKFGTWDTNHVILGYMDKVFEHYGKIMNAVDSLEDFADRIVSAFVLVAMSDSTKNVVRELYANCPTNNQPLRAALLDIIRIMDSSEDQLIAELVSNTLTVVGENACSKLVSKFWNKAILSCVPEVKILISSYKAGKWVSDKLFGTSKIAEECNKVIMTTVFETLMVSTVQKLGGKFVVPRIYLVRIPS